MLRGEFMLQQAIACLPWKWLLVILATHLPGLNKEVRIFPSAQGNGQEHPIDGSARVVLTLASAGHSVSGHRRNPALQDAKVC